MLSDILLWNKIGRTVTLLAQKLNISPAEALDLFYSSRTNQRLHDANDYLYQMSDRYLIDELMLEQKEGIRRQV